MSKTYRWGIVGPGKIAHKFADALSCIDNAKLQAVASSNADRAKDFAKKYSAPDHYASHEELYANENVDIVYVATTHNFHCQNTIDALNAKKHVLCEKPLAVNAKQAKQMITAAENNNVFLMEAMWTRFLPKMQQIRDIIKEGTIGEPQLLNADFGVKFDYDPTGRIYNPNLAGGALLDLGIYPMSFASMIFGKPKNVSSTVKMSDTGVDERSTILLEYENAKMAMLFMALDTETPREARIAGTKGAIKINSPWMAESDFTIKLNNEPEKEYKVQSHKNGFTYQIKATQDAIENKKTECKTMPLEESLQIAKTMDTLRNQWNLKYPFE